MNRDSEEQGTADDTVAEIADPVDEMVDESFPASDPPSGWAGEDPRDLAAVVDHEPDGSAAEAE